MTKQVTWAHKHHPFFQITNVYQKQINSTLKTEKKTYAEALKWMKNSNQSQAAPPNEDVLSLVKQMDQEAQRMLNSNFEQVVLPIVKPILQEKFAAAHHAYFQIRLEYRGQIAQNPTITKAKGNTYTQAVAWMQNPSRSQAAPPNEDVLSLVKKLDQEAQRLLDSNEFEAVVEPKWKIPLTTVWKCQEGLRHVETILNQAPKKGAMWGNVTFIGIVPAAGMAIYYARSHKVVAMASLCAAVALWMLQRLCYETGQHVGTAFSDIKKEILQLNINTLNDFYSKLNEIYQKLEEKNWILQTYLQRRRRQLTTKTPALQGLALFIEHIQPYQKHKINYQTL